MADNKPQEWIEAQKRLLQPQVTDMVIDPATGKYRQVTMGPGTTAKGAWYYSDTGQKMTSGKD